MNVIALTMVHDRILHEGAKRCEGTSNLYTVGRQGSLRAGIRDNSRQYYKRLVIGLSV